MPTPEVPRHSPECVRVAVGLGANLGCAAAAVLSAVDLLREADGLELAAVSPLYRTRPWGERDQPDFVNAVVIVETRLSAPDVLARLQGIERHFGRERTLRWGPRTMDADLLAYGEAVLNSEALSLPHPRLAERGFVLRPLADVWPEWRHPLLGQTAAQLCAAWEEATPDAAREVALLELPERSA
jgi:2-amino-4-hydroxy-6-hydroxymethyldihydropteridine diphosphokinase